MAKYYLVKHGDDPWVKRTYTRVDWINPYKHRRYFDKKYLDEWQRLHKELAAAKAELERLTQERDKYRKPAKKYRERIDKLSREDPVEWARKKLSFLAQAEELERVDEGIRHGAYAACKIRINELEKQIAENHSLIQYERMLEWAQSVLDHAETWRDRSKEIIALYEKARTGKKYKIPEWVMVDIAERKSKQPFKHGHQPKGDRLAVGPGSEFEIIEPVGEVTVTQK